MDLLNTDASGLKDLDLWEANGIEKLFKNARIKSHKGNLGHMLSASGICQSIITSLCIKTNLVPPIQTLNTPINDKLDYQLRIPTREDIKKSMVIRRIHSEPIKYAISNSFSYDGGCFSSILYKKYEN